MVLPFHPTWCIRTFIPPPGLFFLTFIFATTIIIVFKKVRNSNRNGESRGSLAGMQSATKMKDLLKSIIVRKKRNKKPTKLMVGVKELQAMLDISTNDAENLWQRYCTSLPLSFTIAVYFTTITVLPLLPSSDVSDGISKHFIIKI
jgi:hypothetical protein